MRDRFHGRILTEWFACADGMRRSSKGRQAKCRCGEKGSRYPALRAGITSEMAFGTIENLIGKSPIGSPSTCAHKGPSPFGSQIASVDFQASIPSKLRSFPSPSAGKAPRKRSRLFAEFVKIPNETSNRV